MKKFGKLLAALIALMMGVSSAFAINDGPIPKNPSDEFKLYKCLQAAKNDAVKIASCYKHFKKK